MNSFISFLKSTLSDASTGEASTKRFLFFGVVFILCLTLLVMLGVLVTFVFLTPVNDHEIDQYIGFFENITEALLLATTTGYVGGKFVEGNKNKDQ